MKGKKSSIHRLMWRLDLADRHQQCISKSSLAEGPVLAASLTWPASQSDTLLPQTFLLTTRSFRKMNNFVKSQPYLARHSYMSHTRVNSVFNNASSDDRLPNPCEYYRVDFLSVSLKMLPKLHKGLGHTTLCVAFKARILWSADGACTCLRGRQRERWKEKSRSSNRFVYTPQPHKAYHYITHIRTFQDKNLCASHFPVNILSLLQKRPFHSRAALFMLHYLVAANLSEHLSQVMNENNQVDVFDPKASDVKPTKYTPRDFSQTVCDHGPVVYRIFSQRSGIFFQQTNSDRTFHGQMESALASLRLIKPICISVSSEPLSGLPHPPDATFFNGVQMELTRAESPREYTPRVHISTLRMNNSTTLY
ncbi:hypothetical protein F2P81_011990 [Scophthalmus maximus]|uniref:Uncharacterized protein n=1 Tax=Scophthalmus maximus TaxID=52904 RepID=A0A6A4SX45_SCOMX|nr:hypothetical protein F2P81_011990 [Scophthalmus maximus]